MDSGSGLLSDELRIGECISCRKVDVRFQGFRVKGLGFKVYGLGLRMVSGRGKKATAEMGMARSCCPLFLQGFP